MGVLYGAMTKIKIGGQSLYDLYDVVDGQLVYNGPSRGTNANNEDIMGITADEIRKIKYITEISNGAYREDERSVLDYTVAGALIHAFKRTVFAGVRQQFRGTGYQSNLGNLVEKDGALVWEGNHVEGRWFTLLGVVSNMMGRQGYEAYAMKNLSDEHKIALSDLFVSIAYFLILGTLATGLLGDDPSKVDGQIANSFRSDLINFILPVAALDITPVALKYTSSVGSNTLNFGYNAFKAALGYDDAYTQDGHIKGGLQFMKLIPIAKQVVQYQRQLD
jgi:hypothetical protein